MTIGRKKFYNIGPGEVIDQHLEWSPERGSTWARSGFAGNYYTRKDMSDSGEHSTLLLRRIKSWVNVLTSVEGEHPVSFERVPDDESGHPSLVQRQERSRPSGRAHLGHLLLQRPNADHEE